MLEKITNTKTLWPIGVVAFYPANSVGDDIHVFEDDDARKESPRAVFYGLRQQVSEQCQTVTGVRYFKYKWYNMNKCLRLDITSLYFVRVKFRSF